MTTKNLLRESEWIMTFLTWAQIGLLGSEPPQAAPPPKGEAQGQALGISCQINDQAVRFDTRAHAVATLAGGVLLVASHGSAMLMIETPKLRLGTQSFKDTPKLRLNYSRSIYSSDSADHFAANAGALGSQLELKVDRLDTTEGIIVGSFSALAPGMSEGAARITKGTFRLKIEKPGKAGAARPGGQGH